MKANIVIHGLQASNALRDYITRRLGFAFNRSRHAIGNLIVRLRDENGPRGGIDKSCSVQLSLPGQAPVIVSERSSEIERAIDLAVNRAAQVLGRRLARSRKAPGRGAKAERALNFQPQPQLS